LGVSARDIEKTSTIESVQATQRGIKENSQSLKAEGMKKNPKDPKILSIKKKLI
jgi:hypothetical protein